MADRHLPARTFLIEPFDILLHATEDGVQALQARFATWLHVEVISVETAEGRITVRLRIYNGQPDAVPLGPEDVSIAFGFAPEPPGPWITADGLEPFTLRPGQAVDLTLIWAWAGEPYAILQMGGYRFAIQLE